MLPLADLDPRVSPAVLAGLLLAACGRLRALGLEHPSTSQILEATGAGRSRAYELQREVLELLVTLDRPVGRPRSDPPPTPSGGEAAEITRKVLGYVLDHPGCVHGGQHRRRYSDGFRKHVLDLREQHAGIDLPAFAEAAGVPAGTMEDWSRAGAPPDAAEGEHGVGSRDDAEVLSSRVQAILLAYKSWRGNFKSFCVHVREHLRLDLGTSLIATILFEHGERTPRRRRGRSPDEEATRGSFETFFPGAQWVGDGSPITVTVNGSSFDLNFELIVDADSGALVGVSVRDEEDGRAVVEAFEHATETTGESPIALLLDNRPSNHTDEVDEALDETLRIRATSGRAQNKAHVEGAFGLFASTAPDLVVNASDPHELAQQILDLVVETWARTLNHRPRRNRGGKSRADLYGEKAPTPEQIDEARRALEERLRRQQRARQTLEARLDPHVRQILDDAFDRLGLLDPERHVRNAIALYPLDAIVDGIAIFNGKRSAGTLPAGADARYLLGIVRNLHHVHEADAITQALLRERLAARDCLLLPLQQECDQLLAAAPVIGAAVRALVDKALASRRTIDRVFWLTALAERIRQRPADEHHALFRTAARRIHATFTATRTERCEAERRLARALWPID